MKREYEKPILKEEIVEICDIIATSGEKNLMGDWIGDSQNDWPFK